MGEILWHSLTIDPSLMEISKAHEKEIVSFAKEHYLLDQPLRFLEVAWNLAFQVKAPTLSYSSPIIKYFI
jgi:hypothetical protein